MLRNPADLTPLERARKSLSGLSMGDAFGGCFFWKTDVAKQIRARKLPPGPWRWSDDTAMGRAVFMCLDLHGEIVPDALARLIAEEYHREPTRGYGTNAHTVLDDIWQGVSWQQAAGSVFDGTGSCGNGAAMRVAPLGAFFCDDIWRVRDEARRSAVVTHAHPEGQAGAMAVAAAAAWAAKTETLDGLAMLDFARTHTHEGTTRSNLKRALDFPLDRKPEEAAALLGSGQKITSQDTVPFALWCAARHLDSYPEAMWATLAGEGDMDTTCAIVGSIVVLCAGVGIPKEWLAYAEPLTIERPTP
jgi:ADP-ribosylglycohydrolase